MTSRASPSVRQHPPPLVLPPSLPLPSLTNFNGQLFDRADIKRFMLAGNATITIQSKATGERFTFRIKKKEGEDFWFVSLLNGQDNETDYVYIGQIFINNSYARVPHYMVGRKSKVRDTAPSQIAFVWLADTLFEQQDATAQARLSKIEVWHEGKCGRCNRKLTVPESISNGFGPECINYV